ncbi:MAG: hypothetical protein LUF35_03210 [Lachnospiraceae bacterium]|nr:hypothetical protein [Lachnospiraceae bacterium]
MGNANQKAKAAVVVDWRRRQIILRIGQSNYFTHNIYFRGFRFRDPLFSAPGGTGIRFYFSVLIFGKKLFPSIGGGSAQKIGKRIKELERIYGIRQGGSGYYGNQYETEESRKKFITPKTQEDIATEMGLELRTYQN